MLFKSVFPINLQHATKKEALYDLENIMNHPVDPVNGKRFVQEFYRHSVCLPNVCSSTWGSFCLEQPLTIQYLPNRSGQFTFPQTIKKI